jgi:aromatic ring-cleaving dioxygenase
MHLPIDEEIISWHAHVYFDGPDQRHQAAVLREAIAQRFPVQQGRWHDRLVGPHSRPMYQVAFEPAVFAGLVPWLALNRGDLDVLVHPNTLRPRVDHLHHAMWLGQRLHIVESALPERIAREQEDPVVVNTGPQAAA